MPNQPAKPKVTLTDASSIEEFNKWRESKGLEPVTPTLPKRQRGFYISEEAYQGLARLATQHRLFWGDEPSISMLLEKIGVGTIKLLPRRKNTSEADPGSDSTDDLDPAADVEATPEDVEHTRSRLAEMAKQFGLQQ